MVKKLCIFVTIFITSIFCIDKVNALYYEANPFSLIYDPVDSVGSNISYQYNNSYDKLMTSMQNAIDNIDFSNFDYYVCYLDGKIDYGKCYLFNDSNIKLKVYAYDNSLNFFIENYNSSSMTRYTWRNAYTQYNQTNNYSDFGSFTYSGWTLESFNVIANNTDGTKINNNSNQLNSVIYYFYSNLDIEFSNDYTYLLQKNKVSNSQWVYNSINYLNNIINNGDVLFSGSSVQPEFDFTYTYNKVNDYIISVNLLITLNFVDDENYNYYYKFGDIVEWRQLYSDNFINNTFSQLIKYNNTVYFKITDKENNIILTKSFTIRNINTPTKPSIVYEPEYNTEYDTITSINLLTNFNIYDEQNYVCQQKFVDSSQTFNDVDFTTYNCGTIFDNITSNGSVYSRILLNNNIVYSSTYTIYNIGILSPDIDLNFFDRISKSLNYGGPISNMITTPVQILNTIYTAVQFQVCDPVSLGTLFGHELTLPCIDVESILGQNLYMFIDLVCAFYVAINIIGFILDTYNKLMDLHPDSLDSQKGRGGIFK